jgi:hypothetical protein
MTCNLLLWQSTTLRLRPEGSTRCHSVCKLIWTRDSTELAEDCGFGYSAIGTRRSDEEVPHCHLTEQSDEVAEAV